MLTGKIRPGLKESSRPGSIPPYPISVCLFQEKGAAWEESCTAGLGLLSYPAPNTTPGPTMITPIPLPGQPSWGVAHGTLVQPVTQVPLTCITHGVGGEKRVML